MRTRRRREWRDANICWCFSHVVSWMWQVSLLTCVSAHICTDMSYFNDVYTCQYINCLTTLFITYFPLELWLTFTFIINSSLFDTCIYYFMNHNITSWIRPQPKYSNIYPYIYLKVQLVISMVANWLIIQLISFIFNWRLEKMLNSSSKLNQKHQRKQQIKDGRLPAWHIRHL